MTTQSDAPHGVLVVDKAIGVTSHDVVACARRALGTREIGHAGTLDPMATGVLVLVVGEATKLVNHLTAAEKVYTATLRLGQATDSLDADGSVVEERLVPALSLATVREVALRFVGEIEQQVPAVSAVKVQGRALYKSARKGQVVEAPVRTVRVRSLEILDVRENEIDLHIQCSKGFYVRSLGRDLAEALGTVGHLSALRRLESGFFSLAGAQSFADLRGARESEELRIQMRSKLVPLTDVARRLSHVTLSAEGKTHAQHGRAIPKHCVLDSVKRDDSETSVVVGFDEEGTVVALLEPAGEAGETLRVLRGFRFA